MRLGLEFGVWGLGFFFATRLADGNIALSGKFDGTSISEKPFAGLGFIGLRV